MTNQINHHRSPNADESYEHQDLKAGGIIYFLVSLVVVTVICMFGLDAFYHYLDHRERATQEPVNPLVKKVPEDTRHVKPGYPEAAFPSPRLEEDERGQLTGFLANEDEILYSYGWVDEKSGTVRIPIDRAMDLLLQRGLPVLPAGAGTNVASTNAENAKMQLRADAARGAKGKTQ
jgi:hypothetical protein